MATRTWRGKRRFRKRGNRRYATSSRGKIQRFVHKAIDQRFPLEISTRRYADGTGRELEVYLPANSASFAELVDEKENYNYSGSVGHQNNVVNTLLSDGRIVQGWTSYASDVVHPDGRDVMRIQRIQFIFQFKYWNDLPSSKVDFYLCLFRKNTSGGPMYNYTDMLKTYLGRSGIEAATPFRRKPELKTVRILSHWQYKFRAREDPHQARSSTGVSMTQYAINCVTKVKNVWFKHGLPFRIFTTGNVDWLPQYYVEDGTEEMAFLGGNINTPYHLALISRNKQYLIDSEEYSELTASNANKTKIIYNLWRNVWFRHESDSHATIYSPSRLPANPPMDPIDEQEVLPSITSTSQSSS